jgi:hypothetical protein
LVLRTVLRRETLTPGGQYLRELHLAFRAWIQFRRAPHAVQLLAGSGLAVAVVTIVSSLFLPAEGFLLIVVVVIAGSGLTGSRAYTRADGFAGGLILAGAGFFLGFLISVPLTAALQGSGPLIIGFAVVVAIVFGLLYGLFFALVGGVAGYIGARLAKKPRWSWANVKLPPKLP